MDRVENTSPSGAESKPGQPGYLSPRGVRQKWEDENEHLEHSSPTDSRSDEKVIVNAQRMHKTANEPSHQATVNTTEAYENDK